MWTQKASGASESTGGRPNAALCVQKNVLETLAVNEREWPGRIECCTQCKRGRCSIEVPVWPPCTAATSRCLAM
jgi:hypothetical protein